jgi:hypothetical protein
MPNITESTPRGDITIQGLTFPCPQPYVEGHVLTSNEASALNQTFAENVRNNCAGRVKANQKLQAEGAEGTKTDEELLAEFEAYANSYEFGQRRVSAGVREDRMDPVEREARKIARDRVVVKLREKGFTLKSVSQERMEELVSTLSAKEDIRKEAERRVKQLTKISLDELDLDDLGAETPDAPAEEQAAA